MSDHERIMQLLLDTLPTVGIDVIHPFQVGPYNQIVSPDHQLADFGKVDALGVLLGNTKKLWPIFRSKMQEKPQSLDQNHPKQNSTGRKKGTKDVARNS